VTVVVKVGGARAVDPGEALADVAHLTANGEDVVVVHGGSTAVDDLLERLGEAPTYVETPDGVVGRFTDETTMDAFEMALPGKCNTDLVVDLQDLGVNAVGLSGVDGGLLAGPRKSAVKIVEDGTKKIKRGDHSGVLRDVNDGLLQSLLSEGYTPVVTLPMLATDEDADAGGDGARCGAGTPDVLPANVDSDRAAAAIAGALGADLVVLTDVPGVLADPADESTLIDSVDTPSAFERVEDVAEGFMTRKVMAARAALDEGALSVTVAGADGNAPVVCALGGAGTTVTPGAVGRTVESGESGDEGSGLLGVESSTSGESP